MRTAILLTFALPLLAQVPEDADRLFRAQRWAEVERAYATLVETDPGDGTAWLRLGIALQEQGKPREALEAFVRAAAGNAPAREVRYRQARAEARLGRADAAIAALEQAVAAGYRDALSLWREPDLRSLHDDPRFVAVTDEIEKALHPCRDSAERRAFDYWLGEWDVFDPSDRHIARSSIQLVLDGCVVLENFESIVQPYAGKSFSVWRPEAGEWEQLYVDSSGSFRPWKGRLEDGLLVFFRDYPNPGRKVTLRMTYERPGPDEVRQVIDVSTDEGATWTTNWAGRYVRRK